MEDLLVRGPLRQFDQVFYHGSLFDVGSDIGRILWFTENREFVRVEFPRRTILCWVGNLIRVREEG
jgi:hypothetical protein